MAKGKKKTVAKPKAQSRDGNVAQGKDKDNVSKTQRTKESKADSIFEQNGSPTSEHQDEKDSGRTSTTSATENEVTDPPKAFKFPALQCVTDLVAIIRDDATSPKSTTRNIPNKYANKVRAARLEAIRSIPSTVRHLVITIRGSNVYIDINENLPGDVDAKLEDGNQQCVVTVHYRIFGDVFRTMGHVSRPYFVKQPSPVDSVCLPQFPFLRLLVFPCILPQTLERQPRLPLLPSQSLCVSYEFLLLGQLTRNISRLSPGITT